MKLKSILLTAVAMLGLTAATMAQMPNYVPPNGLVGWWPFNGNANDESGNGNNGTVNGANFGPDRFNNLGAACNLDNQAGDNIAIPSINFGNDFTISIWFKLNNYNQFQASSFFSQYDGNIGIELNYTTNPNILLYSLIGPEADPTKRMYSLFSVGLGNWNHLVWIKSGNFSEFMLNGISIYQQSNLSNVTVNNGIAYFGKAQWGGNELFGLIDDVGIWNQALTQQEITDLYNAVNCANNTTITPQNNSLPTGSTATFNATTSDPNPSYVWQSDFGQGFQTLNNFGNYTGANSSTFNIANVQLSEHNQPIRVISTSGNCIDTSNVAVINILDTCLVTVYDTLLTTVTDTLVINTQITGINPPNNLNTLKVYPNPASTHITIDYGNFNAMSGYTLTIVNSIGQTVFTTPINQQTSYIDLSTWTGIGIYFVQLIDPQNNTIENRKIVIQ